MVVAGSRVLRVILAAEESAGLKVTSLLASRPDCQVIAVITSDRGLIGGASIRRHAADLGWEVFPPETVRDPRYAEYVRAKGVDLLFNVHSLHLMDPAVCAAPLIGSFNVHPGRLPEYAGLNAPTWAIYNGETHHETTLHWMTRGIDAGRIAFSSRFQIDANETGLSLSLKCVSEGVRLIGQLLEAARADPGQIPAIDQPLKARRVYRAKERPNDGLVDWNSSADSISRLFRSCEYFPFASPVGHPTTWLRGQAVEIVQSHGVGAATDAPAGTVIQLERSVVWIAGADRSVGVRRVAMEGKTVAASQCLTPGDVLGSARST